MERVSATSPTCPYPAQHSAKLCPHFSHESPAKSHAVYTIRANASTFHTYPTQFPQTHQLFTRFSHDFRTTVLNISLFFMKFSKITRIAKRTHTDPTPHAHPGIGKDFFTGSRTVSSNTELIKNQCVMVFTNFAENLQRKYHSPSRPPGTPDSLRIKALLARQIQRKNTHQVPAGPIVNEAMTLHRQEFSHV